MSKRYFLMAGAVVVLGALFCPILYWQLFFLKTLPNMDSTFFSLQNLAAEQNQELADVERNHLSDFDRLARFIDEGRVLNDELKGAGITSLDMPSYVRNEGFRYFQFFEQKQEQIERYKSALAIVRNSIAYLPQAKDILLDNVGGNVADGPVRKSMMGEINWIFSKTEDYLQDADSGREARLYMKVDELKDLLGDHDLHLASAATNFLSHVRVLIKNKPIKDEFFKGLMGDDLQNSLTSLRTVYNQYLSESEAYKQNVFWYYLFAYFAFVTVTIIFTFWFSTRFSKTEEVSGESLQEVGELRQQNEHLKSKVLNQVESLGGESQLDMMAATLAHEVNTPLGYVCSNLEILGLTLGQVNDVLNDFNSDDEVSSSRHYTLLEELKNSSALADVPNVLDDMHKGLMQIQNVVDDIKSFTQKDKAKQAKFELNDSVLNVLRMTKNSLADHVSVRQNLDVGGVALYGSAAEVNQIIMNLVVNAGHAIEDAGKENGVIEISTKHHGEHAVFVIKDNGVGMDAKTKSKIYEPFFTTKDPGKGTGLGMSVVYNNIRRHNGDIKILSELGKGTAIRVSLPVGEVG